MHKIKSYIFYFAYKFVGGLLPKSGKGSLGISERIRAFLLKGYIKKCGKNVNIQACATIARRVEIGDYSGVGYGSFIQGNVKIGSHVMMGPEVFIYTQNHNHSRIDVPMDEQGFDEEKGVIIGDDVWIGARVTILPGVVIGKGCVIGAGAVVAKTIPPYSIAIGNPAVVKRKRDTSYENMV